MDEPQMYWVQSGMRTVIRDVQEWVGEREAVDGRISVMQLRAYLLALLITAGGYDDDGES